MNKNNNGYIALHRRLLNWEWYEDVPTKVVFIHCLLRANYEEMRWKGITVPRGSFVTSISKISSETGLSNQQTRTALSHLESTQEIAKLSYPNFTIISVKNYDAYQQTNKVSNKQSTSHQQGKQQTTNKPSTTSNKYNNITYGNKEKEESASHNFSQPKADYGGTFEVEGR